MAISGHVQIAATGRLHCPPTLLTNHARTTNLGQLDMRKPRHEHTLAAKDYW